MNTRFVVALLGIATICFGTAGLAQDVNLENKRSRLREVSTLKLRGDARSEFRTFRRKADYYGAFYFNPTDKVSGSFWNASNIQAAERFARISCELKSQSPTECALYARMLPKRYDPNQGGLTLSRAATPEFREYLRVQGDDNRHGAFAIADNGASGYSWAEATRDWAEREALKRCEKATRKLLKKTPDHLRDAVSNYGMATCTVVHWAR
ncbi:hypothetical protein [Shimia sp.]|uniref:hypothetical protein n=1 Tax=Shimia sp. TaxID=1954381 RepID=UPI0032973EFE